MKDFSTYSKNIFSAVVGNPSQVNHNNLSPRTQCDWGFLYLHRVLVQNYSRLLKFKANNSEVPFDALLVKVEAMCLILTSFDLQTLGKPTAPPAGSGNLSIGC